MSFHHVGVAVRDLDRALGTYVDVFGFRQVGEPVHVEPEGVRVCFVEADPGVRIELVEGVTDDSPVRGVIERTGGGPYHLCYQVDDLDRALAHLKARRCRPFRRFDMGGHGRFAFLLSPERQVFELCEPARQEGSR